MSAFQATFSDFRLVKGRKVAQLVFEVPIEAADAALQTLGGVPRPDQEAWVGIARIDPTKTVSDAPKPAGEPKERRRFNTLPISQQAAMRCNEASFLAFLTESYGGDPAGKPFTETSAAEFVRQFCGVSSRADLNLMHPSGDRWSTLEFDYRLWMQVPV